MASKDRKIAITTLITLPEIFGDRMFSIPDYQRGYAWEPEQVKALHKDIENLFNTKHLHFTGTIVLSRNLLDTRNQLEKGDVYDVIDGQQRLTTIIILLSGLIRKLNKNEEKDILNNLYIARGEEGNRSRVFHLNTQIDPYFNEHVILNQKKTKNIEYFSEKRIKTSKRISERWIRRMLTDQGKSPQELILSITTQLGFILYQPDNNAEIGMMFEVINNRGKSLNELEKVKNYLIYYAIKVNKEELRQTIVLHWGVILKNIASAHKLSDPDELTFLRAVCIVFFGLNKTQASKIYQVLKKRFPIKKDDSWKQLNEFVKFMRNCSLYYDALLNEASLSRNELDENILSYVELIRSQTSHANILPVYFSVMDNRDDIEKKQLNDIFRMLEITNFRVYMTRNGAGRSDTGQGRLYSTAHGFYTSFENDVWLENRRIEDDLEYKDAVSALISSLADLITEQSPYKSFKSGLELTNEDKDDFFSWVGLRYFLMNYEREINNKRVIKVEKILQQRKPNKSNEFFSVEHIWATGNDIDQKNPETRFQKRRLGNFMLLELGINIQAQKKDIQDKVDIYSGKNSDKDKSKLKQVDFLINDFTHVKKNLDKEYKRKVQNYRRKLHIGIIKRNENRFIKFAINRWSIEWAENYWEEEK